MDDRKALNQIFRRRWAVPILAELAPIKGCKFVTLASHLEGSRASIRASLEMLIGLGLVDPNDGHGHPMRPEYVLTDRGMWVARPAAALMRALGKADALDLGLKKWSMPTVHAIGSGADRFGTIASKLGSVTDRAVSLTLTDLHGASMIERELIDARPPRNEYSLTRWSKKLCPMLLDLDAGVTR